MQILPGAARCAEIFRLELLAEPRAAPRDAPPNMPRKRSSKPPPPPTTAAAPARWKPSGPKLKLSNCAPPPGPDPAARLPAEAFEALEARLAFGVDLAAVEGLALVVVADDLVGGVELGEARGRLRVVLVGVGMQFLGELADRRS